MIGIAVLEYLDNTQPETEREREIMKVNKPLYKYVASICHFLLEMFGSVICPRMTYTVCVLGPPHKLKSNNFMNLCIWALAFFWHNSFSKCHVASRKQKHTPFNFNIFEYVIDIVQTNAPTHVKSIEIHKHSVLLWNSVLVEATHQWVL